MNKSNDITHSPLGKKTEYSHPYSPKLLFAIARAPKRQVMGIPQTLPFTGHDLWNAYELSWLNPQGKPQVAVAEFIFPCESPNIIESKSLKLYLNSFNDACFANLETVANTLQTDLQHVAAAAVTANVIDLAQYPTLEATHFTGTCLDNLAITCHEYLPAAHYLTTTTDTTITETVYSNLLKSNCPVTGQPDWASVQIHYQGAAIDHAGLLKYIVSYRQCNEFHEQCAEQIFFDIWQRCSPLQLSVYTRYTRRGGLDINCYRSSNNSLPMPANQRLIRQ